jgi:hypothetical protein
VILEPHEGGRWYERGVDGSEWRLGPGARLGAAGPVVFTWQITAEWRSTRSGHASEIEVGFHRGRARADTVEVEQRFFERLVGGQATTTRQRRGGWPLLWQATPRRSRPRAEAGVSPPPRGACAWHLARDRQPVRRE